MSVQLQQFRVVGVNTESGEDVSVVIDAATKAAAEVKAEQMKIETTHIVRLKPDTPAPPSEEQQFSEDAATALAGRRTINLIEEVVSPEEARQTPDPPAPPPRPEPANQVIAAITRPNYNAPTSRREPAATSVSGVRAFGFVLLVLLGITAGAYFVLVHEPNAGFAAEDELIFGQDLFSDVIDPHAADKQAAQLRDAFNQQTQVLPDPDAPPIAIDQQVVVSQQTREPQTSKPRTDQAAALVLQSVVTSHEGRFAVINGKLYKQGAELAGCTLVSVADDWVLMERLGEQFTLQIEQAGQTK